MFKKTLFVAAMLAATAATPAAAVDFSFTGTLSSPSAVRSFDFTVGIASNVTLRSYSYAGGTNAAGTIISRGGFDPILGVYSLPTGALIGQQDDGGCGAVAADAVSGQCWDTNFTVLLNPGVYRASITVFPSFVIGNNFFNGFTGANTFADVSGAPNNPRSANWAFDVLNVQAATQGGVPEPTTWAMLIAGFGLTGAAMRRRRQVAVAA